MDKRCSNRGSSWCSDFDCIDCPYMCIGKPKTREEVEALKKNWLHDPCWDIYETEGFEEYRDELVTFQTNMHSEWRAGEYNRIYKFAETLGIDNLGNPEDEPNLELAKYLDKLETRIAGIEARLERNFHILTQ